MPKGLTCSFYLFSAWILEWYVMVLISSHNKGIPMLEGTEDSTVVILYISSVQQWIPENTHKEKDMHKMVLVQVF